MLFEFDNFNKGSCGRRWIFVQFAGEIDDSQSKALHLNAILVDNSDDLVVVILIDNIDNLNGVEGGLLPNFDFLGQQFSALDHLLFELHGFV